MVNMTKIMHLEVVWTKNSPPGAVGAEEKFSRFFGPIPTAARPIPNFGRALLGPSLTKKKKIPWLREGPGLNHEVNCFFF